MATKTESRTVNVYVRLCGGGREPDECRELSFQIPDEITQKELLEAGYAIDGNSATVSVVPHELGGEYVPLSEALRERQLELVDWFDERGYDVEFK